MASGFSRLTETSDLDNFAIHCDEWLVVSLIQKLHPLATFHPQKRRNTSPWYPTPPWRFRERVYPRGSRVSRAYFCLIYGRLLSTYLTTTFPIKKKQTSTELNRFWSFSDQFLHIFWTTMNFDCAIERAREHHVSIIWHYQVLTYVYLVDDILFEWWIEEYG